MTLKKVTQQSNRNGQSSEQPDNPGQGVERGLRGDGAGETEDDPKIQ